MYLFHFFSNQQPSSRDGTDNDVKSLKKVFGNLGFKEDNIKEFRNLEYEAIINNLTASKCLLEVRSKNKQAQYSRFIYTVAFSMCFNTH